MKQLRVAERENAAHAVLKSIGYEVEDLPMGTGNAIKADRHSV